MGFAWSIAAAWRCNPHTDMEPTQLNRNHHQSRPTDQSAAKKIPIERTDMTQRFFLLVSLYLCAASSTAFAVEPSLGVENDTPPAIAVQACEGEAEGAAVEYTLKGGKIFQGNCAMIDGRLVAVPVTPIQSPLNDSPVIAPSPRT
ncbi:hypothetical protein [Pseudomonas sp. NPDC089569]|uniref:hypothetical protein n=1 Tax=Pseudomonas sp. NPDC089569 TaxID=3390722 RepID=UPI003D032DF9